MKKSFFFFGIIFLPLMWAFPSSGQTTFDNAIQKGIIYDKEITFDFRLHTRGFFSLGMNIGTIKTYYKTQFIHFDLGALRHPREYRQDRFQTSLSSSYVYGKQNSLYAIRGGWGEKRYFSEKDGERGLAIGISYQAGLSLGVLKPYYLQFERNGIIVSEPYSAENADLFLDHNRIQGSSGFFVGWDDVKVQPGAQATFAVHLDKGAFDKFVSALELGVMADVFFTKVPIMINEDNRLVFVNLFVNLQLGKRR